MDDEKKTEFFPHASGGNLQRNQWVSHGFPGFASPDSKRFGLPVVDIFVHMVQAAAHTHRSPRRHFSGGVQGSTWVKNVNMSKTAYK